MILVFIKVYYKMKLDINIFGYIIIGFVIAFVMKIYFESDLFQLKCIVF